MQNVSNDSLGKIQKYFIVSTAEKFTRMLCTKAHI